MDFKQYADIKFLTSRAEWQTYERYLDYKMSLIKDEFVNAKAEELPMLQAKAQGILLIKNGTHMDLKIHENKTKEMKR